MERLAPNYKVESIEAVLRLAKKQGAKQTIITRKNCMGSCWGWILTKNHNLLYVQTELGGFSFSLQYVPTRHNGSGCVAGKRGMYLQDVNIDNIEALGLAFAKKLSQPLLSAQQVDKKISEILQNANNEVF